MDSEGQAELSTAFTPLKSCDPMPLPPLPALKITMPDDGLATRAIDKQKRVGSGFKDFGNEIATILHINCKILWLFLTNQLGIFIKYA